MPPVRDRFSPVHVVLAFLVGILVVGWAVLGLYTSASVDLTPEPEPGEDVAEVVVDCRSVMTHAGEDGVKSIEIEGDPYDADDSDDLLALDRAGAKDRVPDVCDQVRDRRLGRTLQTGLVGAAVLSYAAYLARRRREWLG